MQNKLIGYLRKSDHGGALKFSLGVEAFESAQRYQTKDSKEYVTLIANLEKVREVIDGERAVTSIYQLLED